MKKFKITKTFIYTETLIVEAESEDGAISAGMLNCSSEERIYSDDLRDIEAHEVSPDTPITKEEE